MRRRDPPKHVGPADILPELEKLNRHTAALVAEISALSARIRPHVADPPPSGDPYTPPAAHPATAARLWGRVVEMDRRIGQCEIDLAAIRALVEGIAENVVSREEFRRFLAKRP